MWNTNLTLQFIEEFHSNRCLWDVSFVEYCNREVKNKSMADLAQKYGVSLAEIEKKIHTLKGQFRREYKKMKNLKSGTSPVKASWFGYEPLMFLIPTIESRGSRNTDDPDQTEGAETPKEKEVTSVDIDGSSQSETDTTSYQDLNDKSDDVSKSPDVNTPSTFLRPTNKKRLRPSSTINTDVSEEAVLCMKTITQAIAKKDSSSMFAEFVADSLRNCERPILEVNMAKQKITQILFDLQNGFLNRGSHSGGYSSSASSINPSLQHEYTSLHSGSTYDAQETVNQSLKSYFTEYRLNEN